MKVLRNSLIDIKQPSRDELLVLRIFFILSLGFGAFPILLAGLKAYIRLNGSLKVSIPWETLLHSSSIVVSVLSYFTVYVSVHLLFGIVIWLLFLPIARRFPDERNILLLRGIVFFVIFIFWIILIHGRLYPNSFMATANNLPALEWMFVGVSAAIAIVIGFNFFIALHVLPLRRWPLAAIAVIGGGTIGLLTTSVGGAKQTHPSIEELPNIVVIGIDSLRPDHLHRFGFPENITPNLDELLKDAAVFEKASTPLARTFPSWVSLLTGLEPQRHGGRFNLMPQDMVHTERSIAPLFQRRGYRTVYATDESRFSNIDSNYGFEEVMAPPYGFADFLLGSINDAPLINLLVNSSMGKILMPLSYSNRAAHITYWPETFDSDLRQLIDNGDSRPMFLAVHFCLPHWPYKWGEIDEIKFASNETGENSEGHQLYLNALHRADRQVGDLMSHLKETGHLENTLVVFISDHGESFMLDKDKLNAGGPESRRHQLPQLPGHATSVLDSSQYNVMMAFRDFGRNDVIAETFHTPVSLIDVAPTILGYTFGKSENDFDGLPLDGVIKGEILPPENRIFFRESGFSVPAILEHNPNAADAFHQGAEYYNLNSDNGRLEVRKEFLDELMQEKQRSVVMGRWILAFMPTKDRKSELFLVDSESMHYWKESEFTDLNAPTDTLIRELCLHYKGEAENLPERLCNIDSSPEKIGNVHLTTHSG